MYLLDRQTYRQTFESFEPPWQRTGWPKS